MNLAQIAATAAAAHGVNPDQFEATVADELAELAARRAREAAALDHVRAATEALAVAHAAWVNAICDAAGAGVRHSDIAAPAGKCRARVTQIVQAGATLTAEAA